MQKRLIKFILLIFFIVSGIYIMRHMPAIPSFTDLFKSGSPKIDNTVILVKEINNLAQLVTIAAYDEIAIDSIKAGWKLFNNPLIPGLVNLPNLKKPDEKLIIIGKGKIMAGINLAKLAASDVYVKKDSVSVILPNAEILQVILNPSGFEIFEEKGKWSDDEMKAVKVKARDRLIDKALQQNILQKAAAKGKLMMENFLTAAGFKKISVTIKL